MELKDSLVIHLFWCCVGIVTDDAKQSLQFSYEQHPKQMVDTGQGSFRNPDRADGSLRIMFSMLGVGLLRVECCQITLAITGHAAIAFVELFIHSKRNEACRAKC